MPIKHNYQYKFWQYFLPNNSHLGKINLLSSTDDPLKLLVFSEVTYTIDSNHNDAQWMQPDSSSYNQCRTSSNSKPVPKTPILMPGDVQIHRQVLLGAAKISKKKTTKIEPYKMHQ